MNAKNKYMKLICFVLISTFLITIQPVYSKADTGYELLDKWKENLNDEYEEWTTDFYIDHYGILKLIFSGIYSSSSTFNVRVIDEDGEDIYDKTFNLDFENYVCEITIPEGTYSIAVTSYEYDAYFYLKAYFKETSNVTYNKIAKKAKSMAGKNITFDTIDAGNHGRLYGMKLYGIDDKHVSSRLYTMIFEIQPYIDIQKKNGCVYTKFKIKSKETIYSAYFQDVYYDKIVFTSEDYKMVFNIGSSKTSDKYNYSNGLYTIVCKTDTALFNSDNIKESDINKLIKLLEDKKIRIKFIDSEDDGYLNFYIENKDCKNWIKMLKIYQKLLNLYD